MNPPKEALLKILRDACRAPSGDNVQPWRFSWNGAALKVYNVPGLHNPYLDSEERGAYIAHGALLENLVIAAPHYGYEASVNLFPDVQESDLVAVCHFTSCTPRDEPLYAAIAKRATNRRPYEARPLDSEARGALLETQLPENVTLLLVENPETRAVLAPRISAIERLLLGHAVLTKAFFAHIVWTEREERTKRSGFFLKTMEFNPVQTFVFKLASKPWFMRAFRMLGLPSLIAKEDAKLYGGGSALGGLRVSKFSPEEAIALGRALERVWLNATAHGLALQPLFGTTMMGYKSRRGTVPFLSPAERAAIEEDARVLESTFGNAHDTPTLAFRVGYAQEPSAYTSRKEPNVVYS